MIFIKFDNGTVIEDSNIVFKSYKAGDEDLDLDPKRFTTGELWRNRVVIVPSVELTLTSLEPAKMREIMIACRRESFEVTFWYPGLSAYYKARFYCPSEYRKPTLKATKPKVRFEEHSLKLIGMFNMTEVASI